MRSEFEKIDWVKDRLQYVWWSQNNEYCDTGKHSRANASFLNGALHMFREQQSKVDELQKRLNAVNYLVIELKKLDMENGSIEITSEFVEEIIFDLEQALKGGEA
ncbi:hypothetical protein DX910_00595 [Acinetobacter haemolyticus]|nr:hypothetical protein DX910_00595 [Acinetobacter haemolyticus]